MPPRRRALQETSRNGSHRRNLTPDERIRIVAKSEAGCTTRELANEFRVTSKCIRDTQRRWRLHHTTKDLPRSSRPCKTTPRDVRALYQEAQKTPKIKYKALLREVGLTLSILRTTAYRRLKDKNLTKFRCKRRPKIVRKLARARLI
jgi:transposase